MMLLDVIKDQIAIHALSIPTVQVLLNSNIITLFKPFFPAGIVNFPCIGAYRRGWGEHALPYFGQMISSYTILKGWQKKMVINIQGL